MAYINGQQILFSSQVNLIDKYVEGYEAGKTDGEVIGRSDFVYLIADEGTDFSSMFSKLEITTIPEIDTSNGTSFSYMFQNCSALTEIPEIDTSNGKYFQYMFNNCTELTEIPEIDTSNGTNFSSMFHTAKKLKTIPKLNISKITSYSFASYMFNFCEALENITFEGKINIKLDFSYSPLLTKASLLSIINALKDNSTSASALSLVLGETNLAKLTDEEKAIATAKGWNLT